MRKRAACLSSIVTLISVVFVRPTFSAESSIDAQAESIFAQARTAWQARVEAPFLSYGIRVHVANGAHSWDNWWQAFYRNSDRRFIATRIVIPAAMRWPP